MLAWAGIVESLVREDISIGSMANLAQMGEASVYLGKYRGTPCIHKTNASELEVYFYRVVAPELRQGGVNIPILFESQNRALCLEYIPHSIPLFELNQSQEVCRQLAVIHNADLPKTTLTKAHTWTEAQTSQALAHLSLPNESNDMVKTMCQLGQILFRSSPRSRRNFISGDSNSGNWGRRDNARSRTV